jgi:MerR family transcriptional regulator, thiopeptide resistance regulator
MAVKRPLDPSPRSGLTRITVRMEDDVVTQWFGPAEMAARLGVSSKALRVYERAGLVQPHRTETGWRTYGPDQQARLHQVLVLKRLGLSLARIGELLAGRLASLDAILALQQQVVQIRRDEADRALTLLTAARTELRRTGVLSPDDLTRLTRETTMTMNDDDWNRTMQPIVDKHFTSDEQETLKARKFSFDQAEVTRTWDALISEGRILQAKGDPTSPEAMDLARRWMAQVRLFTGDDPAVYAKSAKVNLEALSDPSVAPKMPFDLSLMQFVGEAYKHAQADG